jgi:hypothetical protein
MRFLMSRTANTTFIGRALEEFAVIAGGTFWNLSTT